MTTFVAFVLALAVLIAVHEWGHYRVAVACGVRVEQFSIGFGPVLLRWRRARDFAGQNTEFVVRALPLGGFVRMQEQALPGQSGPSMAFAEQSLRRRAAIVAAGALANFLLAWLLLTVHGWLGQPQALPVLPLPQPASWAEQQGWQGREQVRAVRTPDGEEQPVNSWQDLQRRSWQAYEVAQPLTWVLTDGRERVLTWNTILLQSDAVSAPDALLARLGWAGPHVAAVIAGVQARSAAEAAGLQAGDRVLRVDGQSVPDAQALRQRIRQAHADGGSGQQWWQIEREGRVLTLAVQPARVRRTITSGTT